MVHENAQPEEHVRLVVVKAAATGRGSNSAVEAFTLVNRHLICRSKKRTRHRQARCSRLTRIHEQYLAVAEEDVRGDEIDLGPSKLCIP